MLPVLEVSGLTQNFGGLRALSDLSLVVNHKEIAALIGPNGAGKTTFFNCITGIYKPSEGNIFLYRNNKQICLNEKKTWQIASLGMTRTFQNIRLFAGMTVLENVMTGCHSKTNAGIIGAIIRDKKTVKEEQETIDKSYALLEEVGLSEWWQEKACNLSYGAQRRLEIARALAADPVLLLLDEPAAGMNPQETNELEGLIRKIRQKWNLSILLIEHDMGMVMSLSDKIYVMEYGACIASGTAEDIKNNPDVIRAYLGESDA